MHIYLSGHFSQGYTNPKPPTNEKLKEIGSIEKKFPHTWKSSCLFRSRAINLWHRAEHNPTTQILTYPAGYDTNPYGDLNRYLTNLKKTYGLKNYCIALEQTKKYTYHFHCIMDMPFYSPQDIKKAWRSAAHIVSRTDNTVRDMRTVKSIDAVMKYCSDYLTKGRSKNHNKRKYTYSRGVLGGEKVQVDEKVLSDLIKCKKTTIINSNHGEYSYTGRIQMNEYINKWLFDQTQFDQIDKYPNVNC